MISEHLSLGVQLYPQGEYVRYRAPKGALTEELREAIVRHGGELLRLLRQGSRTYSCIRCERLSFTKPTKCFWCRHGGRLVDA